MSIIQGSSISAGSTESGGFFDFPIENSLRFDGSSYLSRTFGSGNQKTWTWSGWVKQDLRTPNATLFHGGNGSTEATYADLGFNDNSFRFSKYYNIMLHTNAKFRDSNAWQHFVFVLDTSNNTQENRMKLYVNGVRNTDLVNVGFSFSSNSSLVAISLNSESALNSSTTHNLGKSRGANHFNGYLSNIQFIDGQALSASSFGETKSGVWIPKAYTGSYGTNGFHLQFNPADFNTSGGDQTVTYNGNSSTLPDNHVADISGSGNHWELH